MQTNAGFNLGCVFVPTVGFKSPWPRFENTVPWNEIQCIGAFQVWLSAGITFFSSIAFTKSVLEDALRCIGM